MYYRRKKGPSKYVYLAITLIIALAIAFFAIIYVTQSAAAPVIPGVKVGDYFTYKLTGTSTLTDLNAVEPFDFGRYNGTDYFKVTISDVSGTWVSMNTEWHLQNGTTINQKNSIDLSNGNQTDTNGFWAIYTSNLNLNNKVRPTGGDGLIVNQTRPEIYANSTRERCLTYIETAFLDTRDPTQSTWQNRITNIWFDRETGMLDTLTSVEQYNNPRMTLVVLWQLVDTNVWKVS
jgi:hypothetical protein